LKISRGKVVFDFEPLFSDEKLVKREEKLFGNCSYPGFYHW